MLGTVVLFVIVLSLLVFAHEFGHFVTAKKLGMKVEEFGFGFPPRLFGIVKKGTMYSINWIPIGGFVKIKGESGEFRSQPDSFASKSLPARFAVLVAGVVMNLVLAAALLSVGYMIGLPSVVDDALSPSARVSAEEIRIAQIMPGSPAAEAGIAVGDTLMSIDQFVFSSADEAQAYIRANTDHPLSITLKRGEDYVTVEAQAKTLEGLSSPAVGMGLITTALVSYPLHLAVVQGVASTGVYTWEVAKAFAGLLKNLVVEQRLTMDVTGPVGIAVITGEAAALGFVYLLQFTALLSINLAVLNVMPFPALDGGRLFFLVIEKIRGRALNQRFEAVVHNLGFLFLMLLVILVTYRDLARFSDQIIGTLKSIVGA